MKKYAAFTFPVVDEWLHDHPDESTRSMLLELLELLERRLDATTTLFSTQHAKKDWHQPLGSGVHADAIMNRIVPNATWVETASQNMGDYASMAH